MSDHWRVPARAADEGRDVSGGKMLRLRWAATCMDCGGSLEPGDQAWWFHLQDAGRCTACAEAPDSVPEAPSNPPRASAAKPPGTPEAKPSPPSTAPPIEPAEVDPGVAGASARRQYERRAAREVAKKQAAVEADELWRSQVRSERPILGWITTKVTPKPTMTPESQATAAWKVGAAGEERVAQVLAEASITALHDRRVPGSKANIDHIAIGAAGVFVIDAKKYTGRLEKRDVGGWLHPDVRLYVNNRNQTKLVHGVAKQSDVVRTALGDLAESTPVHGVLCFVDAQWPGWRPKPIRFDTVTCVWPLALPGFITADGPLQSDHITAITARLAETLPPA